MSVHDGFPRKARTNRDPNKLIKQIHFLRWFLHWIAVYKIHIIYDAQICVYKNALECVEVWYRYIANMFSSVLLSLKKKKKVEADIWRHFHYTRHINVSLCTDSVKCVSHPNWLAEWAWGGLGGGGEHCSRWWEFQCHGRYNPQTILLSNPPSITATPVTGFNAHFFAIDLPRL